MLKKVIKTTSGWPMRINKYLAHEGVATRRAADELVARGKVRINDRIATLGDKVEKSDKVEIVGKTSPKKFLYFAYYKPVGVITHSPKPGEKDVRKDADLSQDIFPVGRLDKDSSGLMILTNDGRVTDRLLSPEYEHDKEYRVRVAEPVRAAFKKTMEAGVNIEGYQTRPCAVTVKSPTLFTITITEGKKHQIRRMVAALHNQVVELTRTRILNIKLGTIAPGDARPLMGDELATFLKTIGII